MLLYYAPHMMANYFILLKFVASKYSLRWLQQNGIGLANMAMTKISVERNV